MKNNAQPMHEKLKALGDTPQKIGDFMIWLGKQGLVLCTAHPSTTGLRMEFQTHHEGLEALIARYFEIDHEQLQAEHKALIEEMAARPEPEEAP